MSDVVDIYGVKQIHELTPLNKLGGKEELLIDNGDVTLRVTVDTLLGYIRDQINNATGGGSSSPGTTIHFIGLGEPNIPAESREKGHYYIRVVNAKDAHLATGLPRLIRVSPNMRLRLTDDFSTIIQ